MLHEISFSQIHLYNLLKDGITVPTKLLSGDLYVDIDAKIDTGATYCIFERVHGEVLDFDIESGNRTNFGTATGSFYAYGHELTVSVLGIQTFSTVYFAESEYFDRNVLGRIGWLDRVKLGLLDQEGKLFLSDYNE